MFKSSITKFLIASLGMLMTGLFVTALILAVQAWTNHALAGRIARLTSTDKGPFDALVTVRAQSSATDQDRTGSKWVSAHVVKSSRIIKNIPAVDPPHWIASC